MDRGACQAAVHRVTQSRTRPMHFSTHTHMRSRLKLSCFSFIDIFTFPFDLYLQAEPKNWQSLSSVYFCFP